MNDQLNQNLQLENIEELREVAVSEIEKMGDDEENKDIIIDSVVYLKTKMQEYSSATQQSMQNINQSQDMEESMTQSGMLPNQQRFEEQHITNESRLPTDIEILEMIDSNFEQGLIQLKQLVAEEQNGRVKLRHDQKERLVQKLLTLTTKGYTNSQDQFKQAYSLKALMWLKEELLGLEECYKFTHLVLHEYLAASLD